MAAANPTKISHISDPREMRPRISTPPSQFFPSRQILDLARRIQSNTAPSNLYFPTIFSPPARFRIWRGESNHLSNKSTFSLLPIPVLNPFPIHFYYICWSDSLVLARFDLIIKIPRSGIWFFEANPETTP